MTDTQTKMQELMARFQETGEMPSNAEFAGLDQDELMQMFVDKMIADKGVEATAELKADLLAKMNDRISTGIVKAMPDYLVERIDKSVAEGTDTPELYEGAIIEAGINVSEVTQKEMRAFYDEYVGGEEK